MQNIKTLVAASLLTIAGLQAFSASAEPDNAKTYEVHYTRAELDTANGSARIFSRILETAELVCVDEFGMKRFMQRLDMQRCVKAVAKELVAKIGYENLDDIYAISKMAGGTVRSSKIRLQKTSR